MKVLFSGGGTGGHLFPALAVAGELKQMNADTEIVFVGTPHRIESTVVPQHGYRFEPLMSSGMPRKNIVKLILYLFEFVLTLLKARKLVKRISPDIAVGSGGYVSVTPLLAARWLGVPLILLEQNSVPGLATKLLQRYAEKIHLNYEDSAAYISNRKNAVVTGNPVRKSENRMSKAEARIKLGIPADKKVLLILGGSLGAGSMNRKIAACKEIFEESDVYTIWQTGNNDFETYKNYASERAEVKPFIDQMDMYYAATDMAICRAGATTISELAYHGLPAILIPSPNVANDHQTGNARALQEKGAAVMIKESEAENRLADEFKRLLTDASLRNELSTNIKKFARPDAARIVAESVISLYRKRKSEHV